MDDENFTLPETEWPLLAPFWQACRNEELRFPRCGHCQTWQWYPIYSCPTCGGTFEWAKTSKKVTLFSWTVVRKAFFPQFINKIPLIVAIVDIDDAPGVRFIANAIDCQPEDLHIGMKMDVVFEHVNAEVSLPQFRISKMD